jgi:Domain of unknown function (DUF4337)
MAEIEVKPHHAEDPSSRRVGVLVGVVGIFLSVITIASHRAHTQAVIERTKANDDWGYYQAKKIREHASEVALTLLQSLPGEPERIAASVKKLQASRDKYAADEQGLETEARATEHESDTEERRALRFDIGEGLLELGLVLCSLYFLARSIWFPGFGVLFAAAGILMGIIGWML